MAVEQQVALPRVHAFPVSAIQRNHIIPRYACLAHWTRVFPSCQPLQAAGQIMASGHDQCATWSIGNTGSSYLVQARPAAMHDRFGGNCSKSLSD